MKNITTLLVVATVIFGWSTQAYTWCGKYTHTALTKKAISNNEQSALDEYLKEQLDIEQGLGCKLSLDQSTIPESERIPSDQLEERVSSILPSNPSIMDLLKVGSHLEDVPNPRSKHHFHDPYRNTGLDNKTEQNSGE